MKKFILLFIAVTGTLMLNAQTVDTVALNAAKKQTAAAVEFLKANNYISSFRALTKARNELKKIVDEQITLALPKEVDNWAIEKRQSAKNNFGMGMAMDGISTVNHYLKVESNEKQTISGKDSSNNTIQPEMHMNSRITVTISNSNTWIKQVVETAHKPLGNGMVAPPSTGEVSKAIKIKDFLALSRNNPQLKTSEIMLIVGNGTVQITGMMLDDAVVLQKIAEAIDYSKIKVVFQD